MPNLEIRLDIREDASLAAPDRVRALVRQMLMPPQNDEITERIVTILQDVPEGVFRELCRLGVTISVTENARHRYWDSRNRCFHLYRQDMDEVWVQSWLKRCLGQAFDQALGSARAPLSLIASRHLGHSDADRLRDCWENGDTLDVPATLGIQNMFTVGFEYFCTAGLRGEFKKRAPGLFELMSEFVARYDVDPGHDYTPTTGYQLDIVAARRFANILLTGSPNAQTREQVAKCLRQIPVVVLDLLVENGIRIRHVKRLRGAHGRYFAEKRLIKLRLLEPATAAHEIGHALDHCMMLEATKHDPIASKYGIDYLSELGLRLPGRYPVAEKLAERWKLGQKVSIYAKKNIKEWFAESFKCFCDAGAKAYIEGGDFEKGDGMQSTLKRRDTKLFGLLADVLERMHSGADITKLEAQQNVGPAKSRFEQGQHIDTSAVDRRDAAGLRDLQRKLWKAVVPAICIFLLAGLAGVMPVLVPMSTAAAAGTALAISACILGIFYLSRHWIVDGLNAYRRIKALPHHIADAVTIGRRGTDMLLARCADGTVIEVDARLFSKLVEPPNIGERISVRVQNGELHALTERQTMPQAYGAWLPRTARSNAPGVDVFGSLPIISPERAEPVGQATTRLTATVQGRGSSRKFPWSKPNQYVYFDVDGRTVKIEQERIMNETVLRRGDAIELLHDEGSIWRVMNEKRVNLARDAARVGAALREDRAAAPGSSRGTYEPRHFAVRPAVQRDTSRHRSKERANGYAP